MRFNVKTLTFKDDNVLNIRDKKVLLYELKWLVNEIEDSKTRNNILKHLHHILNSDDIIIFDNIDK